MDHIPSKLRAGIGLLVEASEYAEDVNSDRWEFAVSMRHLRRLGLTETDLRWLVRKQYVEHAREVTGRCDNGRVFRPSGDLTFSKRTCVILTDLGIARAGDELSERPKFACNSFANDSQNVDVVPDVKAVRDAPSIGNGSGKIKPLENTKCLPEWDDEERTLRFANRLVKRFKWRATNQEAILNAFEEEGWPRRIDDPLPPQPEQDSKRRLCDTIKGLNKKQVNDLLRFHGDGTGEGITWERDGSGSVISPCD